MAISCSFLEGFYCRKDAPWTQATTDWKHLYDSKIIKSWMFHFSKQKRITIGQAIWTLFFYYLFPKNIFDGTQLSTIERKVVSNHLSKVKLMIQCLHERYQLLFFNVDESLRDYSSPLNIQNKANSHTTFGKRKTSKPSRKVEPKYNSTIIVFKQIHRPSLDGKQRW